MAELGIDVGTTMTPSDAEIAALGVTWVRCVATPNLDLSSRLRSLRERGIKTLIVIAHESMGENDALSRAEAAKLYDERYGDLAGAFEVGNEPDGVPNSASWLLEPESLNDLLRTFRAAMPTRQLWCAGMVSGQPDFLRRVELQHVDRVAVHPYTKQPNEVRDFLRRYAAADVNPLLKPVVVTEWGAPSAVDEQHRNDPAAKARAEAEQAVYYRDMARTFRDAPEIAVALLFSYEDGQDAGGFGIVAGDRRKPSYDAYISVTGGSGRIEPTLRREPTQPAQGVQFVMGFRRWADLEGALLGEPLVNESHPAPGLAHQRTTHGLLTFVNLPAGELFTFYDLRDNSQHLWRGADAPSELVVEPAGGVQPVGAARPPLAAARPPVPSAATPRRRRRPSRPAAGG